MSVRLTVQRFTGFTPAFGPAFQASIEVANEYEFPIDLVGLSAELYFGLGNTLLGSVTYMPQVSSGFGLFECTVQTRQKRGFQLTFHVPFGSVAFVDRQRRGDPQFTLKVWGAALHRDSATTSTGFKAIGVQDHTLTIPESDWARWVHSWGRDAAWLYVSGPAAAKLHELRQRVGKQTDEDFVWELAARLAGWTALEASQEHQTELLVTLPEMKQIREHLLEWLPTAIDDQSPVSICCQAIDGALQHTLLDLLRNRVPLRIIMRPLESFKEKGIRDAVKTLTEAGTQFRFSGMVHARLYIMKTGCLITAADPKTDSLDVNREAGIWTDAPAIVERAQWFFERLWEECE